ncbi:MAG: hypothetical protein PVJ83_10000, partial [Gammaproteobacteria bacterium]
VSEDVIHYTNRFGTSIGNLVDDTDYFVINVGDGWIKLADNENDAIRAGYGLWDGHVVNLIDQSGTALATADNERAFSGSDVDATANSITLLDDNNSPLNFNKFEKGQAVVYHQGTGSAISGLDDGGTYYVITPTSENNLQGDTRFADGQVIQLAESENEANVGIAIDIGAASGSDYSLTAKHVLDSGFSTGIGVTASLGAEDNASAGAGLQSEDFFPSPWAKVKEKVGTNVPDLIFSKLTASYAEKASAAGSGQSSSLSVAGALAFTYANHTVKSEVGSNAVLNSNEDLEVTAGIEENFQITAQADFEPQETAGLTVAASTDNAVSVAVDVGIFNNTATATVHGGAKLDGLRATRVISGVTYPFLTRPDTYVPTSAGEFVDSLRSEGPSAVTQYLDTTLGTKGAFFNAWAASTAKAENLGIAGSVNVLVFDNTATATVETGVEINQDSQWHGEVGPDQNPYPGDTGVVGQEVVQVSAGNSMQAINMTGIFSLPSLNLDPTDDTKFKDRLTKPSAYGGSGDTGGAGGAFFIDIETNTTHAIVEDGARINSGADGGFKLSAYQTKFAIDLTQAGASGGKLAIGGSVAYLGVTNDTLAQLGSGAVVTGRDARIYAGDLESQINWVGGIAKGENVGIGIAVAINNFNRTTRAVIGEPGDLDDPTTLQTSGGGIATSTSIDVTGDVIVDAKVDGELWAATVAGAAATGSQPDSSDAPAPDSGDSGDDALDGFSLPALFGEDVAPEGPGASKPSTSVGFAAAVSINIVSDDTQAVINDAGKVIAGHNGTGDVSVTAENALAHQAITGGAAFASGSGGQSANALAGALSFNNLTIGTRAFILDTEVDADNLTVSASRTGQLLTISAGAAGSTGNQGIAVAGSVSVNRLVNATKAYLDGSSVDVGGDGTISATDESDIFAFGGGIAISGSTGVGFSIGFNEITGDTLASINDAQSLKFGGDLSLTAMNDNALRSIGISAGAGRTTGVAFTIGINLIINTDIAEITDSTLTSADSITVLAQDDSVLEAIGGALGIG